MSNHEHDRPSIWGIWTWRLAAAVLAVLITLTVLSAERAEGRAGLYYPYRTDTTWVSWSTANGDTASLRATYLDEAEPLTPMNGSSSEVYVSNPASSAGQRVGIVGWVESLPDSVIGHLHSATLTLYRLNGYDAAGANDTLEIAPVTVAWTEAQTTWSLRRLGRPWSTPGGDVDTSYAVRVRAGDIPNLASGPANAAVTFDITEMVRGWVTGNLAFHGVVLRWRSGNHPVVRFQDNAAGAPYRPQIEVRSYTTRRRQVLSEPGIPIGISFGKNYGPARH